MLRLGWPFTRSSAWAILGLALAAGVGSGLAGVAAGLWLHPLPFNDSDRVMLAGALADGRPGADPLALWRNTEAFSDIAAYATGRLVVGSSSDAAVVAEVTSDFFRTLGVAPRDGRVFTAEEERGELPLVEVDAAVWQATGGGSFTRGRDIRIAGRPFEIIGILPQGFAYPSGAVAWVPFWDQRHDVFGGALASKVIARLQPGISLASADVALKAAARRAEHDNPFLAEMPGGLHVRALPLRAEALSGIKPALLALFACAIILLAIGAANFTSYALAVWDLKSGEVATRVVLGASRGRIAALAYSHILVAACGAAVASLPAAGAAAAALAPLRPPGLAGAGQFWAGCCFACTLACALFACAALGPAIWRQPRLSAPRRLLRGRHARGLGYFVAAQLALCVSLATAGGLLFSAFRSLLNRPTGASLEALYVSQDLGSPEVNAQRLESRSADLIRRLRSAPGVTCAAAASRIPFEPATLISVPVKAAPGQASGTDTFTPVLGVSAGYFHCLGIPILAGRDFGDGDSADSVPVAIISEDLARSLFGARSPLGRAVYLPDGDRPHPIIVVGVVGATRVFEAGQPAYPELYRPMAQSPESESHVLLAAHLDPSALRALWKAEASKEGFSPNGLRRARDVLAGRIAPQRQLALLAGWSALVAAGLAGIGLWGLAELAVKRDRREIAIRNAVGAQRGGIVRWLLGRLGVPLVLGVLMGAGLSYSLARGLAADLYGVPPLDPRTWAMSGGILALVVVLGMIQPVVQALRVPPSELLKLP